MIIETKNNRKVLIRKLISTDFDILFSYLEKLSEETKKRFEPHAFDKNAIIDFYAHVNNNIGFIAYDADNEEIIAYSIIKMGFLEADNIRLKGYGLEQNHKTDCTFAPSVADAWQSTGIGTGIFKFIISELKTTEIKRIILWGGVQATNEKAINYYKKNGFKILRQFFHNVENYDMALDI
jgi:diamine N-acetyltransferase